MGRAGCSSFEDRAAVQQCEVSRVVRVCPLLVLLAGVERTEGPRGWLPLQKIYL